MIRLGIDDDGFPVVVPTRLWAVSELVRVREDRPIMIIAGSSPVKVHDLR